MRKLEFVDVAGEALEETRQRLERIYPQLIRSEIHDTGMDCRDLVNMALGMFSGSVLRRLRGEPDPGNILREAAPSVQPDTTPPGRKSKSKPSESS